MDLKQRKLNKSEWNSIEVPVSKSEIDILNMIVKGYHDVNIRINNNSSIFTFLKIEYTEKMEDFIILVIEMRITVGFCQQLRFFLKQLKRLF